MTINFNLKGINIVFFGSGDFPVPTFKFLIACGFNVVGLVTSNDKVTFNDKRLVDIAKEYGIPYYIPTDLKSKEFISWLYARQPDLFCVISYKMLPNELLRIPSIDSFNVHASLLPFLRGAAPIQWAIRLGFKYTGLTSFILNSKMDCGDIIHSKKLNITDTDTYGTLSNRLSEMCCNFTYDTIMKLLKNENHYDVVLRQPICGFEGENELLIAPKYDQYDYHMCNYRHPEDIKRVLRSIAPVEGLNAKLKILEKDSTDNGRKVIKTLELKVYDVDVVDIPKDTEYQRCGNVLTDGKTYMYVVAYDAFVRCLFSEDVKTISIKEIQLAGKKRMGIEEFLRGFQYGRKENYEFQMY